MIDDIVVNELSFRELAATQAEARSRMIAFVSLLGQARRAGFRGDIRIPLTFFSTELVAGYTVTNWISDPDSPREHRTYLLSQGTKSPFLINLPILQEIFGISEFRFQGELAEGLGAAYLMDALGVSLQSQDRWRTSILTLDLLQLDRSEELVSSNVNIPHASRPADLTEHAERLAAERYNSIKSGKQIWEKRNEFFPGLLFVQTVEQQLDGVGFHLPHVLRRLIELEDNTASWKTGGFDPTGLSGNPRTESSKTLEEYGQERSFRCPDGTIQVFSWHVNLPGGWRLHFFPVDAQRRIIIGYIGTHLPTVKFN